ncbi:MAG: hypothetical protein V4596_12485 [Bdellovibrionota bacterium]
MKKRTLHATKLKQEVLQNEYQRFDLIDGTHPWQEALKDQVVLYPVRELNRGKIMYFNYRLAKEMGLIPADHPQKMNKDLEKKLLKTFSIQIINEFEQENKIQYDPSIVKKNMYMATRYLQLQHDSRSGKTSGDGRSIWNGCVHHQGKIWDISSRGTGVTKLAPGAVKADKPLQTGNEDFGYSCGQMEIDELYATAISSEIFHHNKISTERVLAIVDLGKGLAIGVRAAPNLMRPAHLFLFLKQNDLKSLKSGIDYMIERQVKNREWTILPGKNKYDQFLEYIVESFAKFMSRLDVDYIFAWLDWDGDNILANAGIIDYGSIRQFGLRHDQYRYDDIERFSTTLGEQKLKARQLVQTFAQIVDFIKSNKKTNVAEFRDHSAVKKFDKRFIYHFEKQRLYNIGFQKNDIAFLLDNHFDLVLKFEQCFKYFESIKTQRKPEKVADGINHPAIFNMRDLSRELPSLLLASGMNLIEAKVLFDIMISTNASLKDCTFKENYTPKLLELQAVYLELIEKTRRKRSPLRVLIEIEARSKVINRADRVTGNAIIMIVEKIITNLKSGFPVENVQELIEGYVESQLLVPGSGTFKPEDALKRKKPSTKKLLSKLFIITSEMKDEI